MGRMPTITMSFNARPGTPLWIKQVVHVAGFGCKVTKPQIGAVHVALFGASARWADDLYRAIIDEMPAVVSVDVEAANCPSCNCAGGCAWRTRSEIDPDAVRCETCQCRWCGSMRKVPALPATTLAALLVTHEGVGVDPAFDADHGGVTYLRRTPDGAIVIDEESGVTPEMRAAARTSMPMSGCKVYAAGTPRRAPGAVWRYPSDEAPLAASVVLDLTKALRVALAAIAPSWDACDRKALHGSAHEVCEIAEAVSEGVGAASLQPFLLDMLGILTAAEQLGPMTARLLARTTLGATRLAFPSKRRA